MEKDKALRARGGKGAFGREEPAPCACGAGRGFVLEMQFGAGRVVTAMAASNEIIYDVLRELAFIEQKPGAGDGKFLEALTDEPDLFKIILTSQARGSIPTSLWTSSYFVFIQSL